MTLYMTASYSFACALVDALGKVGWAHDAAQSAFEAELINQKPNANHGADGRVPVAVLEALFETAKKQTGDPSLALRAGHRFRVSSFGKTGSIYAHARDLPDVIALNGQYQRLAIDLGEIRAETLNAGSPPCMVFRPHEIDADTGLAVFPHCVTMLMGAYVTAYRWLNWGSGEELAEVGIPVAVSEPVRETAEKLLRCPIKFGGSVGYLAFTERAMTTPLITADAEKRALSVAKLDALVGAETGRHSFRDAVHAAIRGALGHSVVSLGKVAERLDLSEAQFRRTLREYGWSFRAETDRVRQAVMAERYAAGDNLSAIALALGYNDQAAFNRAVKRWYGVPPGQWNPDMVPLNKN
jgi:AraC-like DNA-binding protein